jgi:hypothetical protein
MATWVAETCRRYTVCIIYTHTLTCICFLYNIQLLRERFGLFKNYQEHISNALVFRHWSLAVSHVQPFYVIGPLPTHKRRPQTVESEEKFIRYAGYCSFLAIPLCCLLFCMEMTVGEDNCWEQGAKENIWTWGIRSTFIVNWRRALSEVSQCRDLHLIL